MLILCHRIQQHPCAQLLTPHRHSTKRWRNQKVFAMSTVQILTNSLRRRAWERGYNALEHFEKKNCYGGKWFDQVRLWHVGWTPPTYNFEELVFSFWRLTGSDRKKCYQLTSPAIEQLHMLVQISVQGLDNAWKCSKQWPSLCSCVCGTARLVKYQKISEYQKVTPGRC